MPDHRTTYYLKPYYKRYRILRIETWIPGDEESLAAINARSPKTKDAGDRIHLNPKVTNKDWWNLFPKPFMNNTDANELLRRAIRKG
jgi:hypothetical protein